MDLTEKQDHACSGAIILAGGDSKRLGRPKALLDFGGQTLIELIVEQLSQCFDKLTVVTDRPDRYLNLPVTLAGDILSENEKSPLRGIHAGLSMSKLPWQFVVACDMPFLNIDLIKHMSLYAPCFDAVVPRIGEYHQPLHAFYSRTCIAVIEKQVGLGQNKVTDFYKYLKIKYIGDEEIKRFNSDDEIFLNINTWGDYQRALRLYNGKTKTG